MCGEYAEVAPRNAITATGSLSRRAPPHLAASPGKNSRIHLGGNGRQDTDGEGSRTRGGAQRRLLRR